MTQPNQDAGEELLTDDQLKAIEDGANAATQGPWLATNPDDSACMNMYCVSTGWEPDDETELEKPGLIAVTLLQTPGTVGGPHEKWQQNADFIAHARSDVPALIREIRRLQSIVEKLLKTADDVPITHGMMLYPPCGHSPFKASVLVERHTCWEYGCYIKVPRNAPLGTNAQGTYRDPATCYSTRAAALVAAAAPGEGIVNKTSPTR